MDLFKFLKRKQVNSFELLLKKAADNPAYRVEFLKRLLTEKLVVITKTTVAGGDGFYKVDKDTTVQLSSFADGSIPVFTSTERIFDKGIIKDKVKFLEFTGKDLLEILKGKKILLNPYSDYGKVLLAQEVERLLDGSIFKSKQIVFEKATTIQIGQPAKYPTEVVNAMRKLFAGMPEVRVAYLGWIYQPDAMEPPHYIFGIDTDGAVEKNAIEAAGDIAQQILGPEEMIDFIGIGDDSSLSNYLKSTQPFYIRPV